MLPSVEIMNSTFTIQQMEFLIFLIKTPFKLLTSKLHILITVLLGIIVTSTKSSTIPSLTTLNLSQEICS
jgi:hypothetical protein